MPNGMTDLEPVYNNSKEVTLDMILEQIFFYFEGLMKEWPHQLFSYQNRKKTKSRREK